MSRIKDKVTVQCSACGASITRYQSQFQGVQTFCSKACVGRGKWTGEYRQCFWCREQFYRAAGEINREARVREFCSKSCYSAFRALERHNYAKGPRGQHKHRIVAEACLGRKLRKGEVVHHIDNDKQNNHPSNLAVFPSQAQHAACHFGKWPMSKVREFALTK